MKVIKIKAKVCHLSEEQLEAQDTYDLGNIARSKEWVWRQVGLEVPCIYRIEEYDSTKSIVITYDNERILVRESFESLFDRWQELKETQPWKEFTDEEQEEVEDDDEEEN